MGEYQQIKVGEIGTLLRRNLSLDCRHYCTSSPHGEFPISAWLGGPRRFADAPWFAVQSRFRSPYLERLRQT